MLIQQTPMNMKAFNSLLSCFIALFIHNYTCKATDSIAYTLSTILPATVNPEAVRPGDAFKISYNWDAQPMANDYTVWVHIRNGNGETVLQDDHTPPFPTRTSTWSGGFNYTRLIRIPSNLQEGEYSITAGLYGDGGRQALVAGTGVIPGPEYSYQIALFTVDADAPIPPLDSDKEPTLDLTGYHITFQDEFDGSLDVSALGPGTKWIAHTP